MNAADPQAISKKLKQLTSLLNTPQFRLSRSNCVTMCRLHACVLHFQRWCKKFSTQRCGSDRETKSSRSLVTFQPANMSGDEVGHPGSSTVYPLLICWRVWVNYVNYGIRMVMSMTLGLATAAPLPVRSSSHMASAELTMARSPKLPTIWILSDNYTLQHLVAY